MDLDKLKNTWQSAEIKSTLDEDKVQKILDKRGQTAIEKLVKYEKAFLYTSIGAILFLPMFWYVYPNAFWLYLLGVFVAIPWQGYKYKYIKSLDIANLDVMQTSQKINTYRKYLSYEFVIGIVWTLLLSYIIVAMDIFSENGFFKEVIKERVRIYFTSGLVIVSIVTFLLILIIYYKVYWKNIKAVMESIKEVDYFKKDNY